MKINFTKYALSILLAASMSVPAVSPVLISAQDFEETPAQEGTQTDSAQTDASQDAQEENEQTLEYAKANGIEPKAGLVMNVANVDIDLADCLSSNLQVPVYPWEQTTASKDVTDKTAYVTVKVDFQELLAELPDKFDKLLKSWEKARQWPLVTQVDGKTVNGMPIDLRLTIPNGYTLENNYEIDDQTGGVSYKWADYGSDSLLSDTRVIPLGNFVDINLTLGYVQYGTLIDAIRDGKIGSWTVRIPVTYSATKGEDITTAMMNLTGTAGDPFHMTGLGVGLRVPVTVEPAEAPLLVGVPEEPAGIVDDSIDVKSALSVNGQTSALSVTEGTALNLEGSLDVKAIKDKLTEKIEKYGVGDQLDKVSVHDVDLKMNASITLPEQVEWNGDASSVKFAGDVKDFTITSAARNGDKLDVEFALSDASKIATLKDLVEIMNATPDTLSLNVGGLTAVTPVEKAPMSVKVTGDFNAAAVIPSTATYNPGYYDVHYAFNDTNDAAVDLTIAPKPASRVDEVIDVESGLKINGQSGNVSVLKDEALSMIGSLNVKPIKSMLEDKIAKYNVASLLDRVDVKDLDLAMTTTISLPDQVAWSQKADSVAFAPANKDFKITSAAQKGQVMIIQFSLADTGSIKTLADLYQIMNDTPDELAIQISGLTAKEAVKDAKVTANVQGTFNADALIPDGGNNPGQYDITYRFEDSKKATVGLTINEKKPVEPGKPNEPGKPTEPVVQKEDLYRLYNPNSGEHFYTANAIERDHLIKVGWSYEGVGWTSPKKSNIPVYRLYNPNAGDHHYTLNENERDVLIKAGWKNEGIGFYSLPGDEGIPVYREYNPNAKEAGAHNYTTNIKENDFLLSIGWLGEGVGWRAYK